MSDDVPVNLKQANKVSIQPMVMIQSISQQI